MKTETWKYVVGYEGHYEVSSIGNVRSVTRIIQRGKFQNRLKGKSLKLQINKHGYSVVMLSINKTYKLITVHRLVANAFIENPDNRPQIKYKAMIEKRTKKA